MAVITRLDQGDVASILSAYAAGELLSFDPVSTGIENSNYIVTTREPNGSRQRVMTIIEQDSYSGAAYPTILDVCHHAGLPVAPLIRTRIGEPYAFYQGKRVALTPRLRGHHVHQPTLGQVSSVGRLVARLHQATGVLNGGPAHPRSPAWLSAQAEALRGFIAYPTQVLIDDGIASLHQLMTRSEVSDLSQGVIHGDLFRDNLLFDERGLTGVIDFHHASLGFHMFDLAVAVNDWCSTFDGTLDHARTLALLRAYHNQCGLTQAEIWTFGLFLIYAGVTFLVARLSVNLSADGTTPTKNPQEFERIVCQRLRYPYLIDQRSL
ncbi:MAG: homoserine kinase [Proteobacteria bacterium]|nr:homoserine kinase [Pseudomonadota bacterium]